MIFERDVSVNCAVGMLDELPALSLDGTRVRAGNVVHLNFCGIFDRFE